MQIKSGIRRLLEPVLKRRNPIYKDDTFLVSYPKSGNTWLRFILCNLLSRESERIDFHSSLRYIPNYETKELSTKVARPRVLKSHSAYRADFQNVIYIVRDPRDVYVSFYHYVQKRLPEGMAFSEFLQSNLMFPGRWHEHVDSWKNQKNVALVLRYEDLLLDPLGEVRKMVSAIPQLAPSESELQDAVAQSSFESMSKLEFEKGRPFRTAEEKATATKFVRSGKAGGWKEFFSDDDLEFLLQEASDTMREFGYHE